MLFKSAKAQVEAARESVVSAAGRLGDASNTGMVTFVIVAIVAVVALLLATVALVKVRAA
jgi:hypothetical protein